MPNFRGLIGLLQRFSDRGLLNMHNTDAMLPERYPRLAIESGMSLEIRVTSTARIPR